MQQNNNYYGVEIEMPRESPGVKRVKKAIMEAYIDQVARKLCNPGIGHLKKDMQKGHKNSMKDGD